MYCWCHSPRGKTFRNWTNSQGNLHLLWIFGIISIRSENPLVNQPVNRIRMDFEHVWTMKPQMNLDFETCFFSALKPFGGPFRIERMILPEGCLSENGADGLMTAPCSIQGIFRTKSGWRSRTLASFYFGGRLGLQDIKNKMSWKSIGQIFAACSQHLWAFTSFFFDGWFQTHESGFSGFSSSF